MTGVPVKDHLNSINANVTALINIPHLGISAAWDDCPILMWPLRHQQLRYCLQR